MSNNYSNNNKTLSVYADDAEYLSHPGLVRFVTSLAKRLPPVDMEALKRLIVQAQFQPRIDAPLFDFATFINTKMPDDQWETIVDGAVANFAAVMADKSKRLAPETVQVAPSLGSPVASHLTIGQGDIEALEMVDDPGLSQSLHNLKASRQQIRSALRKQDLNMIQQLGLMLVASVKVSAQTGQPFMQVMADLASKQAGKDKVKLRSKQLFVPLKDTKVAVPSSSSPVLGEGALSPATVATLLKAGRFIFDTIQIIWMLASTAKAGDVSASIASSNPTVKQGLSSDSFVSRTSDLVDTYGDPAVKAKMKDALAKFNTLSPPNNRVMLAPGASEWYKIILTTWVDWFLASVYKHLQKKLAEVFKKRNPKAVKIYNFLTPPPSMPAKHCFSSLFDPTLLKDSKIMDEEFVAYNEVLKKLNPETSLKSSDFTGMSTGLTQEEVSAFKPFSTLSQVFDRKDGWEAVINEYVQTVLIPYLPKLISALADIASKTYGYVSKIINEYPGVSPTLAFGASSPLVKPWSPKEMDALFLRLKTLQAGLSPSKKLSAEDKTDESEVNKSEENSQISNPPSPDTHGTILVTPNETVINLGHYIDPTTNKMSDYADLYVLGKAIRDAKHQARMLLYLPHQSRVLTGDVMEGGILDIALKVAGKVGKKVLNSKIGQRMLAKLPKGIAASMVKAVGATNPRAVSSLADKVADKEALALHELQKTGGIVPTSPSSVVEVINAVQTLAPVIQGMDEKLDQILNTLNKFSFHTLTTQNVVDAGLSAEPIASRAELNAGPVLNLTDAVTLTQFPEIAASVSAEPSAFSGDLDEHSFIGGDIDLWRVV